MNAACFLYSILLLLEGTLAWILSGQAFLLVASFSGMALYICLRHPQRPLAEGTRLITAILLAVAGPLQYQIGLAPLLLCFISLPHFLAATQALAEPTGTLPSPESPRRRSLVFTIAFYTSMGLVLLLARGVEPAFSRPLTNGLALGVLLLALPAWDLSRIPRLRPARPTRKSFSFRRFLLPATLLGLVGLLYYLLLPIASDFLCRLSPHWSMNPVEFKNKPPLPPPTSKNSTASTNGEASRLGMDESSVTGEHALPSRSNLQSSEVPRFFIQPDPPALTATLLAQGPIYLRSHTLNRFQNNKWTPEVSGGVWIEDAADGQVDGIVTLVKNPPVPLIPHEVFAFAADGYTLPALAGLTAIHLPRLFAIPGEVLQSSATGDIRYTAVSAPVLYQALPNPNLLAIDTLPDRIHLALADGELGLQLNKLADSIFGQTTLLADRLDVLHRFLSQHYRYSTVMRNPHQLGPLENFLFDEKAGHCDFYATAAALLLRHGGIPTRIAYGFASREANPTTGLITVRDRHAHAWTEIFLKNYGWTICDFTPSDNIGQPADPATPAPPIAPPDLSKFSAATKEINLPTTAKTSSTPSPFTALLTFFQQQTWLPSLLKNGPWITLGFAFILLGTRLLKRRPSDLAVGTAARADYERQPVYFQEFLRLCAAVGHPKPEGDTPLEHYYRLQQAGLPVPPLRPLIDYHCVTRYADFPRDDIQEKKFSQDLQDFEKCFTPKDSTVSQP